MFDVGCLIFDGGVAHRLGGIRGIFLFLIFSINNQTSHIKHEFIV